VLALENWETSAYLEALGQLFDDADLGELVALYQALPILPHPTALVTRAAEGVRSNMKAVFEAVALRNPYPAEFLDTGAFNQMVLKCLFVGSPLHWVFGLDDRVNGALAGMVCDYARERWAASRSVPPELWRVVGPVADGPMLELLARALREGSDIEKMAVILACTEQSGAAAVIGTADSALVTRIAREGIDWEKLAAWAKE
jgi:hypothetical protein